VAFCVASAYETAKIYLISTAGGTPQPLLPADNLPETFPGWSPDGRYVIFGRPGNNAVEHRARWRTIRLVDVRTRQVTDLVGPEEVTWPRWSPDGRYLAALTFDSRKLLLYDFRNKQWTQLAESDGMHRPSWSYDSSYVYAQNFNGSDETVFRVRIRDRKWERVVGRNDVGRRDIMVMDLAPTPFEVSRVGRNAATDSSLTVEFVRSGCNVYALDLELP
jgi:Tol biopolymer transport system component